MSAVATQPSATSNGQPPVADIVVRDVVAQEPVGGRAYPVKSQASGLNAILFDRAMYEQAYSVAVMFSKADIVPAHFRDKPSNCFIACQYAFRTGMDPVMVMQQTHVVHGKLGFSGQFVIAMLNASGLFKDPLDFEFIGKYGDPNWAVEASAVRTRTGKVCKLTFRYATAIAEGWVKQNPKWSNMPEQMMMYRSASFFGRVYSPETLMGMVADDELEDVGPERAQVQNLANLPEGRSAFRDPAPVAETPAPVAEEKPEPPTPLEAANETLLKKREAMKKADDFRAKHGCRGDQLGCTEDISMGPNGKPVCSNHFAKEPGDKPTEPEAPEAAEEPAAEEEAPKRSPAEIKADIERSKTGCKVGLIGCDSASIRKVAGGTPRCKHHKDLPQSQ